jgi:hypothetical protein
MNDEQEDMILEAKGGLSKAQGAEENKGAG